VGAEPDVVDDFWYHEYIIACVVIFYIFGKENEFFDGVVRFYVFWAGG
jgi:hypothetical protein